MTRLHARIAGQGGAQQAAAAQYHPWGTPDTPVTTPGFRYAMTPAGIGFEQAHVIIAADGSPIYAGTPGGHAHRGGVHLAGRP